MTEIMTLEFRGDAIPVVRRDDDAFVPLRAPTDALGLDFSAQRRMIERSAWSEGCVAVTAMQLPGDTQVRQHFMISHRIVPMWIANISASRIKDEAAKAKVIAWQREFAGALFEYVFNGGVINPRANQDQLDRLIGNAEGQMRILKMATGLVDPRWLEAKTRHTIARALGEEPEVNFADRPLTIGEYLQEKGVAGSALRSLSGTFGKRVKAAYRERHGAEPPTVERFVDGALRQVAGYTEAHRDLFEAAWVQMLGQGGGQRVA